MKISVIGCGYLGAVHAAALAHMGHDVTGIDVDERKIGSLARGRTPIYEPQLPELLSEGLDSGRLRFSTDAAAAHAARVHFICVGTPQVRGSDAADLRYVTAAIESLRPHLGIGDLIVGKSTVPVGTAESIIASIAETGAALAWNPEFLREGFAVQDTLEPDRLVYGVADQDALSASEATALLDEVYADQLARDTPRLVMDLPTSELVKTAANAFLATKISFINAMAEIAETTGADVTALADALGYDSRIGRRFLNAGVGFGGGCLPKDIRALTARAEELGRAESVGFLREVDAINLRRRERVIQLAADALGGSVVGKRIAILGLAFKPSSDDIRDSPALDVAVRLHGLGADVVATDPQAVPNARLVHPQLQYATSTTEALNAAELVLLITEWPEYRALTPETVSAATGGPRSIIDARNVLEPQQWDGAGWDYYGLGRR